MATAAPAAPSTSAQPAQPAPASTSDAASTSLPPISVDSIPRVNKPLKPIPSLPGVLPDGDPFPLPKSPKSAATSATPTGANSAARGPDGRFLPGSSPGATDGEEHAQSAGDEPATGKYKFGGEEFESQEAAEQNFRSLRGQYRPIQSLARSLGGVDKIVPHLGQAAESARGWHAEAQRLLAENEALRNGTAPARTSAPTAPDAAPDASESVDWELYAEIKKLATDSGEPWKADQWLTERQDAIVQARVQRILNERLQPLADSDARNAVAGQTETLFSSLAGYTNTDGSVAFPELHDEKAAYEVGRMWASMGLPPEAALTPQGAIAAIAIYRMGKGNRSQASTATPPSPAAAFTDGIPTDAHAAAALDGGRGRPMASGSDGGPSAQAAAVIAGLRQVNSGNRALLGFEA